MCVKKPEFHCVLQDTNLSSEQRWKFGSTTQSLRYREVKALKLGIMQPYFFPYLGYWQLLNEVDWYVIYDDVNYIKGGWINRNRILINGEAKYYNLPLQGASPNKLINTIEWENNEFSKRKMLRSLQMHYARAPYFREAYPLLEAIIRYNEANVARFLKNQIEMVSDYLEIHTKLLLSSQIEKDSQLRGESKVIDICKILGASTYINAVGGQMLYSKDSFQKVGIQLKFLKTGDIIYPQFKNEFVPNLSIIDVMMFNSKKDIQDMLNQYTLL